MDAQTVDNLRQLVEGLLKCLDLRPAQRKTAREYLDACGEGSIRIPRKS